MVAAADRAEYPVLRLAHLGERRYDFLLWLNRHFNWLRGKFGAPYWSLSAYVKNRVKQALEFINSFEETLARECASREYWSWGMAAFWRAFGSHVCPQLAEAV